MLISVDTSTDFFGDVKLFEPEINREASEYLAEHYYELIEYINKCIGIRDDKAYDLLHDVYASIVEQEDNLEGFDENYISSKIDAEKMERGIRVGEFVRGRICGYSRNVKYRSDYVEAFYRETKEIEEQNGMVTKKIKIGTPIYIVPASADLGDNGHDVDSLNEFEMSYAIASCSDDLWEIDQYMSIREEIEYCINMCNAEKINIKNIMLNLSTLDELLDGIKGIAEMNKRLFSKLNWLIRNNEQFAEAFASIMEFASNDRETFNRLVASF